MTPPRRDPWVVIPRPTPQALLRLFCFPHAGAGASAYVPWGRAVAPQIEVVAVQPPGRESRLNEPPFSDALALAYASARALEPYLDRPYAFFGHSAGALIAFEVARTLRREGRRLPVHFFASGRGAPQVSIPPPHVHAAPHDEFMATLRRYGGTPPEVLEHPELMSLIEPILRADFSLGETYRYAPEAPLDVPISAYYGTRDEDVPFADVERWGELTSARFRTRPFDGDHFFIQGCRQQVIDEVHHELRPALHASMNGAGRA